MESKLLTDAILKFLIDERDLCQLPYNRVHALAGRIAAFVHDNRTIIEADDLELQAFDAMNRGDLRAAFGLEMEAEEKRIGG